MKLYTEKQVKNVWKAGQKYWETSGASITLEELLEHEKPIEIPSDEEISTVGTIVYGGEKAAIHDILQYKAFKRGAKWMRDKIQGGNNEQ